MLNKKNVTIAFLFVFGVYFFAGYQKKDIESHVMLVKPQLSTSVLKQEIARAPICVSGVTKPHDNVTIASRVSNAIVKHIIPKIGSFVKKGAILIELDPENVQLRLKLAKSAYEAARLEHTANETLGQKSYISKIKILGSKAALDKAEFDYDQAKLELERMDIHAPYDCVVEDIHVDTCETVSMGKTLISIADISKLKFSCNLSQQDKDSIADDSDAFVEIDGKKIQAKVDSIAQIADPNAHSFEVILDLYERCEAGLSARAVIFSKPMKIHKVKASYVVINDNGDIGVKYLTDDNVVQTATGTLLHSDSDYLWIRGLPEKINVITKGQEFVSDGLKITL